MENFIEGCFSWPSWPATLLLMIVCSYWLLVMFGALDLDFLNLDLDFDMDVDVDVDASVLQFGFVPLKWLNLGSVPTMLWGSVFALTGWMASRLINSPEPHATFSWMSDGQAILRDTGIALLMTKVITQPLRGKFDPVEPNKAADLVGQNCVVTTSEVTETFGEAEFTTDGAPLRLTVRSADTSLTKGDTAVITDFDPNQKIYQIQRANSGADT